jgi:hypothetical protein
MKAVGIGSKEALGKADINISGFQDITIEEIKENMGKYNSKER